MELPVNLHLWLLAALPIFVLLVLIVKYQVGAIKAAPVGLIIAIFSGLLFYKASFEVIIVESAKGLWNAFTVLVVIWPAILLYEVTNEAKAFDSFRKGMQKLSPNELLQILAIGWVFVSFLQGITGFGVPVAVGAPLLVGIGVRPLWAVTITLLGHAWANTFGTLAVAWDALVLQTNLEATGILSLTALWAAAIIWLFNFISGITICWWYGKVSGVKKGLTAVLIISTIQCGGQLILTQINTTLAAFIPASLCLPIIVFIGKMKIYRTSWHVPDSPVINRDARITQAIESEKILSLNQAFMPYYYLILITLVVLLIGPINNFLGFIKLGFSFPETITGFGIINKSANPYAPFRPFVHAGTFLFISALLGYLYFRLIGKIYAGGLKRVASRTIKKSLPSTIGIVALIVMSKIMGGSGQIMVLAEGTAQVTASFYALLSPMIGILGSFITSSNLASNILFGEFQQATATILGINKALILAAQTAGGAMGNTISPGNVLLGTTTVGILGKEGLILKMIFPITLCIALLVGLMLLLINVM